MKKRVGDTLIEVTLAVGIFSMVAIAVVSVMNGGTSSSQTALETTLTREEIDTQAEALRFIQSAYIADMDSGTESNYTNLWNSLESSGLVIKLDNKSQIEQFNNIINNTTSCNDVYKNNDFFNAHAFIINPHDMTIVKRKDDTSKKIFVEAANYPRLLYANNNENSTLLDDNKSTGSFFQAQGIYVLVVRDTSTTSIVDGESSSGDTSNVSSFYDFYIQTCWYGAGDESSSTISTVVRLYNPSVVTGLEPKKIVTIRYDSNSEHKATGNTPAQQIPSGHSIEISKNGYFWSGHEFIGWNTQPDMKGGSIIWDIHNGQCKTVGSVPNVTVVDNKCIYTAPSNMSMNSVVTYYAMWNETITIQLEWGDGSRGEGIDPRDLDSHVHGFRSDGNTFHAYYGNKIGYDSSNGLVSNYPIASLDYDITQYKGIETFTINTLGGKNFYYYVNNFSKNNTVSESPRVYGATVTADIPSQGQFVFSSHDAPGPGPIWNVFAYIDGQVISCPKQTSTADVTYTTSCPGQPVPDPTIPKSTLTINFNSNGGSGNMSPQIIQSNSGSELTPNAFTHSQYDFTGWNTKRNGSGTSYSNSAYYSVGELTSDKTITLYAQWQPKRLYLQDITLSDCQGYKTPQTAYDRRDGNSYTVSNINGYCWMNEDLKITGGISKTDSNFTHSSYVNVSEYALTSKYYYLPASGQTDTTVYYNYCAARAGYLCTSIYDQSYGDICPKNWRMPTLQEARLNLTLLAHSTSPGFMVGNKKYYKYYRYPFHWSSTPANSHGFLYAIFYKSYINTTNLISYYGNVGIPIRCMHK